MKTDHKPTQDIQWRPNRAPQTTLAMQDTRVVGWSLAMLRGLAFLALVGGASLSAWNSFQKSSESPLDWAVGEVHAMVTQDGADDRSLLDWLAGRDHTPLKPRREGGPAANERRNVEAQPVELHSEASTPDNGFTISTATLAAITCGPWDLSEAGMEAILQEMVRRGWTPPSRAHALASSRHAEGLVQAVDSDAPASAAPGDE